MDTQIIELKQLNKLPGGAMKEYPASTVEQAMMDYVAKFHIYPSQVFVYQSRVFIPIEQKGENNGKSDNSL